MAFQINHIAMGCPWEVVVNEWSEGVEVEELERELRQSVIDVLDAFNATYSRFRDDSLVAEMASRAGVFHVPADLVVMVRMCERMYRATGGLMNPLIGQTLSDAGYDATYSLKPKDILANTPRLDDVIRVVDDMTLELSRPALIDLGSIGKGYAVDKLSRLLEERGVTEYLVNGSGDMRHMGTLPARIGLEHPADATSVIGVAELQNRSIASSGANRRRWGQYHHIIDPTTHTSPDYIQASWVIARTTAEADLIATALFLVTPESLAETYEFEYILVNADMRAKQSSDWPGELYV